MLLHAPRCVSVDVSLVLLQAPHFVDVGVSGGVLVTAGAEAGLGEVGSNARFARRRACGGGGVDGGRNTTSTSTCSVSDTTDRCAPAIGQNCPLSWLQAAPSSGVASAKSSEA